jgi:hypothetical protein
MAKANCCALALYVDAGLKLVKRRRERLIARLFNLFSCSCIRIKYARIIMTSFFSFSKGFHAQRTGNGKRREEEEEEEVTS